jgi:NADH-quinone oxidoreductase subunit L
METKLWLIPTLPLLASVITIIWGKHWIREKSHWLPCIGVGFSFLLSLITFFQVWNQGTLHQVLYSWISSGDFEVSLTLQVDPLTAIMAVVVSGVSFLIHIYSIGYMQGDEGYHRFFSFISLFTFSMLMLVMSANFLLLYVFWEAVGLCSYLLIGHWYYKKSAADAAKKAFIVNRVGDFGFGLGVMLLFTTFGTLDYQTLFSRSAEFVDKTFAIFGIEFDLLTLICLLLFTGAIGKSAQFPLHVWLPDAMEGPTPVSALIHAATMVTAGVYLVARCHPLYSLAPKALFIVALIGGFTAFFAATVGLVQNDIKRVLAYSTISQLGYMFMALGVGAYVAAIFHLVTHAFFKALLFLASGSVIHALGGEQDMRNMGGLKDKIPGTYWTFLIGALALAGIPPLAGFWSKDEILVGTFQAGYYVLWILGSATAFMTAFYIFRLIFMTFFGDFRGGHEMEHPIHESPPVMLYPLAILAVLSIFAGWILGFPPEHGFIHTFLAPTFAGAQGPALLPETPEGGAGLMFFSILVAALGILTAWMFYVKKPEMPAKLAETYQSTYDWLLHKYWFDEMYEALFVNPTKQFANLLWQGFDNSVIDGIVNGIARSIEIMSAKLRRLQSGYLQQYALSMVIGVIIILGIYLLIV